MEGSASTVTSVTVCPKALGRWLGPGLGPVETVPQSWGQSAWPWVDCCQSLKLRAAGQLRARCCPAPPFSATAHAMHSSPHSAGAHTRPLLPAVWVPRSGSAAPWGVPGPDLGALLPPEALAFWASTQSLWELSQGGWRGSWFFLLIAAAVPGQHCPPVRSSQALTGMLSRALSLQGLSSGSDPSRCIGHLLASCGTQGTTEHPCTYHSPGPLTGHHTSHPSSDVPEDAISSLGFHFLMSLYQ